ncbi:MAG: hypothetical protein HY699_02385 [Deltaproteobacteria bacterium]|nr:hypothetical protein [Deltaproteobacteria bacterium]
MSGRRTAIAAAAKRRAVKRVLRAALAALLLFGALTAVALEGREVVVLRTFDQNGTARDTRTWIADAEGAAWVEAANAERPFLLQLRSNPQVELLRGGSRRRCRATVLANPDGHQRIRRLLSQKYGWADWWIGMLADTTGSLALRLECAEGE